MAINKNVTIPICNKKDSFLRIIYIIKDERVALYKGVALYKNVEEFLSEASEEDLGCCLVKAVFKLEDGTEDGYEFNLCYIPLQYSSQEIIREDIIKNEDYVVFDSLLVYKLMLINELYASGSRVDLFYD